MRLNENIQHVTVLVHCTPQIVTFPLDGDKDFVEMPGVAASALAIPQLFGKGWTNP